MMTDKKRSLVLQTLTNSFFTGWSSGSTPLHLSLTAKPRRTGKSQKEKEQTNKQQFTQFQKLTIKIK